MKRFVIATDAGLRVSCVLNSDRETTNAYDKIKRTWPLTKWVVYELVYSAYHGVSKGARKGLISTTGLTNPELRNNLIKGLQVASGNKYDIE